MTSHSFTMTRVSEAEDLISQCSDEEIAAILSGLPGWIRTSDLFVDVFAPAFDALDDAAVQYARAVERRVA